MATYTYVKIDSSENALVSKVETISRVHSFAVAYPLWTLDFEGINRSIQTIALHPEIICVAVTEVESTVFFQWPLHCARSHMTARVLSKDLLQENQRVGRMNLYYTSRPQRDALFRELLLGAGYLILLMSVAGIVVYVTLQHTVGRPINRLLASIDKSRNGSKLNTVTWPSNDEFGNVISAYNTMINQIDHNTQELIAARQQAETASYIKSRFLANMSHELRTPLNSVIGITEMLKEDAEENHNDTEPYDRVSMSGRHLLQLIDDVLDFSSIDAGKVAISMEEIDIEVMLKEVCSSAEPIAESRNNQLEIRFKGTPKFIVSDPMRLRQILVNLLSNACKFTRNGSIILEAAQVTDSDKQGVRFSVSDSGIGLSKDQLEHLFTAFYQADISNTRQYGGTGLGLAISQQLCRLLGSEISVESTIGEGSVFSFSLMNSVCIQGSTAATLPSKKE